jgi:hypothetical protein
VSDEDRASPEPSSNVSGNAKDALPYAMDDETATLLICAGYGRVGSGAPEGCANSGARPTSASLRQMDLPSRQLPRWGVSLGSLPSVSHFRLCRRPGFLPDPFETKEVASIRGICIQATAPVGRFVGFAPFGLSLSALPATRFSPRYLGDERSRFDSRDLPPGDCPAGPRLRAAEWSGFTALNRAHYAFGHGCGDG